MESRKRKRDAPPLVLYYASHSPSFGRLFAEDSIEEMVHVVQRKLALNDDAPVKLAWVHDEESMTLEDDDDFACFALYAQTVSQVVVRVTLPVTALPSRESSHAWEEGSISVSGICQRGPKKKKRRLNEAHNQSTPVDTVRPSEPPSGAALQHPGTTDSTIAGPSEAQTSNQKPRRKKVAGVQEHSFNATDAHMPSPPPPVFKTPALPSTLPLPAISPAGPSGIFAQLSSVRLPSEDTSSYRAERRKRKKLKASAAISTSAQDSDVVVLADVDSPSDPERSSDKSKRTTIAHGHLSGVSGLSLESGLATPATSEAPSLKKRRRRSKFTTQDEPSAANEVAITVAATEDSILLADDSEPQEIVASKSPSKKKVKTSKKKLAEGGGEGVDPVAAISPPVATNATSSGIRLESSDQQKQPSSDSIPRTTRMSGKAKLDSSSTAPLASDPGPPPVGPLFGVPAVPGSKRKPVGKASRGRLSVVLPCPVCQQAPFHLRYLCPVMIAGPDAIEKRLLELKEVKGNAHKLLIQELEHVLVKERAKRAARALKDLHAPWGGITASGSSRSSVVSPMAPALPNGSLVSEVTVESRDEGSSHDSSSEEDKGGSDGEAYGTKTVDLKAKAGMAAMASSRRTRVSGNPRSKAPVLLHDDDPELDALLRGPPRPPSSVLDKIFDENDENGDEGADDESVSEPLVEDEDDDDAPLKGRGRSRRVAVSSDDGSGQGPDGDDDEDEDEDEDDDDDDLGDPQRHLPRDETIERASDLHPPAVKHSDQLITDEERSVHAAQHIVPKSAKVASDDGSDSDTRSPTHKTGHEETTVAVVPDSESSGDEEEVAAPTSPPVNLRAMARNGKLRPKPLQPVSELRIPAIPGRSSSLTEQVDSSLGALTSGFVHSTPALRRSHKGPAGDNPDPIESADDSDAGAGGGTRATTPMEVDPIENEFTTAENAAPSPPRVLASPSPSKLEAMKNRHGVRVADLGDRTPSPSPSPRKASGAHPAVAADSVNPGSSAFPPEEERQDGAPEVEEPSAPKPSAISQKPASSVLMPPPANPASASAPLPGAPKRRGRPPLSEAVKAERAAAKLAEKAELARKKAERENARGKKGAAKAKTKKTESSQQVGSSAIGGSKESQARGTPGPSDLRVHSQPPSLPRWTSLSSEPDPEPSLAGEEHSVVDQLRSSSPNGDGVTFDDAVAPMPLPRSSSRSTSVRSKSTPKAKAAAAHEAFSSVPPSPTSVAGEPEPPANQAAGATGFSQTQDSTQSESPDVPQTPLFITTDTPQSVFPYTQVFGQSQPANSGATDGPHAGPASSDDGEEDAEAHRPMAKLKMPVPRSQSSSAPTPFRRLTDILSQGRDLFSSPALAPKPMALDAASRPSADTRGAVDDDDDDDSSSDSSDAADSHIPKGRTAGPPKRAKRRGLLSSFS